MDKNSIIVGFSKPKGWFEPFSWVIRLFTWAPYSHTYIKYYSNKYNRWIIYQASGLAVNFIGQTMFDSKEDVYSEFDLTLSDDTKTKTIQYAIDKCGSPYGVGQIVGLVIVLAARLIGKKIENPFYSGSSYVCSELVSDILEEIIGEGGGLDPKTATPKDVYNFLVSKGFISHAG